MKRAYAAGFGCRQGCSAASLRSLLEESLHEAGISADQLLAVASIDRKKEEAGLRALAHAMAIPLILFSSVALSTYEHGISQVSDIALQQTGSASVAEAAALACAESLFPGLHAELFVRKRNNGEATFAVACVTLPE